MANKVKVEVELDAKVKEAKEKDAFKGPKGQKAEQKIQLNSQVIAKLLQQASLTTAEFKKLNSTLKSTFKILEKYTKNIDGLSKSVLELKKQIDQQLKNFKPVNNTSTGTTNTTNTSTKKPSSKPAETVEPVKHKPIPKKEGPGAGVSDVKETKTEPKTKETPTTETGTKVKEEVVESSSPKSEKVVTEEPVVDKPTSTPVTTVITDKVEISGPTDKGEKPVTEEPKEAESTETKSKDEDSEKAVKYNATQESYAKQIQAVDAIKNSDELILNDKQREDYETNKRGAEAALASEDWKMFREYFNNMVEILQKAAVVSGKVSEGLQELVNKQAAINKEIENLETKKESLEKKLVKDEKGNVDLSAEAAKELLDKSKEKDKIKDVDGNVISDPKQINANLLKLKEEMERGGKTLQTLTDKMAQDAGFADKKSALAANRFFKEEDKELTSTQKEIEKTDQQIAEKKGEESELANQIKAIQETGPGAANALQKIYAELAKIKNTTNTNITQTQKEARKESQSGASGAGVKGTPSLDEVTPAPKAQNDGFKKALKQTALYHLAIRTLKKAIHEAVRTVKELDKALTEQAMVTGLSRKQTYGLLKSYQELAVQCGATTKEVAGVATEYIKQGKSIQEAMTLTEAAVSAAKVAGVSTSDSVNYLTTALNGFQLSANDAMLVSDKFAAIAAASATDYDELAIALSKVASQANLAGMSIDYTSALLTKGLETTREAPETMGTALKTIIARMRELGDYGKTLEDGLDLNNVESQLAYVGIALRDSSGELRSTEDVLDELGRKWDELSTNQQAAVAKALAGTRQQARLIAMMEDYDRVIELQDIAERSQGATAAQAATYLEGIEASLNKVTTSWETLVTTVTDSEVIINVLDWIAAGLQEFANYLSTEEGMSTALTVISVIIASIVLSKIREHEITRKNYVIALKKQQAALEEKKLIVQNTKKSLEKLLGEKKILQTNIKQNIEAREGALIKAREKGDTAAIAQLEAELKEDRKQELEVNKDIKAIEYDLVTAKQEERNLNTELAINSLEQAENANFLAQTLSSIIPILSIISSLMGVMNTLQMLQTSLRKKDAAQLKKNITLESTKTTVQSGGLFASIASAFASLGPWGVPVGIATGLAALAIVAGIVGFAIKGIGTAIGGVPKGDNVDAAAENVNALSAQIYKLQESVRAIDSITDSVEELDKKIIKTKKDTEEMESLLSQAGDKLSTEENSWAEGITEKDYYDSLATNEQKLKFLKEYADAKRAEIEAKQEELLNEFKNNSELLNEKTTNAKVRKAQNALYNDALYDMQTYIDKLKEKEELLADEASAVEDVMTSILESASLSQIKDYAFNDNLANKLTDKIKNLTMNITDAYGNIKTVLSADVLSSDSYTIAERTEAFQQLANAIGRNTNEFKMLSSAYSEFVVFEKMSADTLKKLDELGIDGEGINNFQAGWSSLKKAGLSISEDEYTQTILNKVLPGFSKHGNNISAIIDEAFGVYIKQAKDSTKAYTAVLNQFQKLIGAGQLNMSQNVTKLKNTVNGFYEKASEWHEMSAADQAEFMLDNSLLFDGEYGEDLLKALNTSNWTKISEILSKTQDFQRDLSQQLKQIELELALEMSRTGDDFNAAYVEQLKGWKKELENQTDFFRADLEFLLEKEQEQLDLYREFLEKQQEELEESLDQRKEAYEKYFEAINKQTEDEDYQEQSDRLVANLSKLSSSTDMASQAKMKELRQELDDLEEERQKTLRQRAQDAVLESIDSELEKISDKFDDLLNNEQLLLQAMLGATQDPTFLTQMLASARHSGMTDLQIEEYAQQLASAFGSMDIGTDNLKEIIEQVVNNATINIGNQSIDLNTEDGNQVWKIIEAILRQYGYR